MSSNKQLWVTGQIWDNKYYDVFLITWMKESKWETI